jgi:type IV pilus assembly protein PilY1
MKKIIALCLAISLVFPIPFPVFADDSDIFGSNIEPNVLIVLDTSGSMDDSITTPTPYNPNQSPPYSGIFNSGKVFKLCFVIFLCEYAANIDAVGSSTARTALSTSGYWSGSIGGSSLQLYVGNYVNYYLCGSCQGTSEKKIDIAKRVINDLLTNVEGVRFGVMRFDNNGLKSSGGGGIVAEIGTAASTIVTLINAITVTGWTPLGRQMDDAGRYYKGETLRNGLTYTSPIQYSCQPNFAIVISDGMWTDESPAINPATEATNRYTQDHSSLTGPQNVIVHTVGFSIAAGEQEQATAVLQQMATNGGGVFYSANNSTQLEQALQDAIRRIVAATFSFATPVVPTTSTTGSSKGYIAAFQSNPSRPFWRGFLKAYQRDSNGQVPVDVNGVPLDSALVWEAGAQLNLKTAGNRKIYTRISGALEDFVKTNANITYSLLGVSTSTERDKVIDFVLGIDSYDEDADTNATEERAWKLGDIFHSTPVLISPPNLPTNDPDYPDFRSTHALRTTVLIAGANDGMVHAIKDSNGEELWGFIPPNLLSRLKDLPSTTADHSYYVDSSPVAADIKISGAWKTIIVFGQRRGGKSYYALDVSNTLVPAYLWSFTDSKMGETWSEMAIGKVKISDGTEKFVGFVGGGYDTGQNNNSGKAFFAVDLATGSKLWEYYKDGTLDDRQYMGFSLASAPTAVDTNADGYVDRVYIGDIGGQLWKFDIPVAGTALSGGVATNWTGKRLFAAAPSQTNPPATGEYYPAQAIYVPPALALDASGGLWVYFGTGDRNHPNNTATNRFYGIKDTTTMSNGSVLTEVNLTDVTSGSGSPTQGWYIRLANNEKVLAAADVFNKFVAFSTFTPTTAVACGSGGGTAKLYAVNMMEGDAGVNLDTGAVVAADQSAATFAKVVGTGIPSRPFVTIRQSGVTGIPSVITGTTNQQLTSNPFPPVTLRRLARWREVF